jgi:Uma2 family endonuclease
MRAQAAAKKSSPVDTTFYPADDNMGEELLHREIVELFRALLQYFFSCRNIVARVGANTFIYWVQFHPEITIDPDLYVMHGIAPDASPDNWKLWENGVVPSFVLEVVSKETKKDYTTVHEKYDAMGVPEVIIFDPKAGRPRSKRVRWQIYRRIAKRGLVKVEVTNGDRVFSKQLGCWLRMVGEGNAMRVRIATGDQGDDLIPTEAEAAAARAEAEAARAAAEAARAAAEAARAAAEAARAEAAEAEVARLRRQLDAQKGRRKRTAR